MGIRFICPNGHKLHVKSFLAGRRGVCPKCGASVLIPSAPDEPEEAERAGNRSVGGPFATSGQVAVGRANGPTDSASQSDIIAVVESVERSKVTVQAGPRDAPSAAEVVPPPLHVEPAVVPISSPLIDKYAKSPASRYVARRERNRRNQLVLAVVLLVSVIVLAVVLILVLQRGSGTSTSEARSSIGVDIAERIQNPGRAGG
jgi:hypothetical protein